MKPFGKCSKEQFAEAKECPKDKDNNPGADLKAKPEQFLGHCIFILKDLLRYLRLHLFLQGVLYRTQRQSGIPDPALDRLADR